MRKNKKLKRALALLHASVPEAQYAQAYAGIAVILEKASTQQLALIEESIGAEHIGVVISETLEALITPQVSAYLPRIYAAIDWHILSEVMRAILHLEELHSVSNKPGYLYETYLNQFLQNSGSEYFTPQKILDLILDIVSIEDHMTVYDPCCSTGNIFLAAAQRAHISAFGQECNQTAYTLAKINSLYIYTDDP